MNDDTDAKVDYLNSPDIGAIGGAAIEGFKAPVIEKPTGGFGEAIAKSRPVVVPEDNSAALRSVRAEIAENSSVHTSQVAGIPVEIPKVPLTVNKENSDNLDQMMEDNLEAEKRKQQVVIVKENPFASAIKLTGKIISSVLRS